MSASQDQDRTLIENTTRIVDLDDRPVLRNLLISQCYGDLSHAMAGLMGDRKNIVWVSMACWSSKTVGRFIRNEEVPDHFKQAIRGSSTLQRHLSVLSTGLRTIHSSLGLDPLERLLGLSDRIIKAVSGYLTVGNKIVFAELGGMFADFVLTFSGDTSPDPQKLKSFLARYPDGPPEPDKVTGDPVEGTLAGIEVGGKTLLKQSMASYYKAMFTRDAKEKAELLLLANGQGGVHEQTRLQTYIAGSLNAAGAETIYNRHRDALLQTVADKALLAPVRTLLDKLLRPLSSDFEKVFREFATSEMMKLKLPDGELRLGRDLPAAPGQPLYPPALETLRNPELRSVLKQYGALGEESEKKGLLQQAASAAHGLLSDLGVAPEKALGSRARDWGDLAQRMRYILQLFRSRAQDQGLYDPIFSPSQRAAMLEDRIPEGPLS